jgi:CRISPR-associated protein Cmr1
MAGADKNNPEMRAASIKGCMRFIWRAIQGAADKESLRSEEGILFGSAYGENENKQSDMRIRIVKKSIAQGLENMTAHREGSGYSGVNKGKKVLAQAIKSGSEFDVIISGFGETPEDENRHINFVRLFVVTCLLYGFGRRSRKGFGTVQIKTEKGEQTINVLGRCVNTSLGALADNLNLLLLKGKFAKDMYGVKYEKPQGENVIVAKRGTTGRPGRYPYIEKIEIIKIPQAKAGQEIINRIGLTVHNHSGNDFLGLSRPRFASSLLLSTASAGNENFCVITQLCCTKAANEAKLAGFYNELRGIITK